MTFIILCLAAFAMVAYGLSLGTALLLWVLKPAISSLTAAGQSRLYFVATLLPALAGVVLLFAALAPSFGWIADHYTTLQVHSHPHLCFDHPIGSWPTMTVMALAAITFLRIAAALAKQGRALWVGKNTQSALRIASREDCEQNLRIIPTKEPQAFVLGLFRPSLYITQGLLSGPHSAHAKAVIAHEQAHMQRRDPLRRFVAELALCCHLPKISTWLGGQHSRSQERAADALAGHAIGNREAVASALVALAKAHLHAPVPQSATAFSGSEVSERVLLLLAPPGSRDWPSVTALTVLATFALAMSALQADAIHHQIEHGLGLLGLIR